MMLCYMIFFLASFKKVEVDKFVPVLALLCRICLLYFMCPRTLNKDILNCTQVA